MFIAVNENSRKTTYRLWFTTLVIVTAVFGLVLIIYEDWQVTDDNISHLIPAQESYFYIHFNNRTVAGSSWLEMPLFNNIIGDFWPDFSQQLVHFSDQNPGELAYVLFFNQGRLVPGWLVVVHDQSVNLDLPSSSWQSQRLGEVVAASYDPEFFEYIKKARSNEQDNLKKYLQLQGVGSAQANYAYLKAKQSFWNLISQQPYLAEIIASDDITGEWLIEHSQGRLQVTKLSRRSSFRLPFLNPTGPAWPQLFLDSDLVFYNTDKDFITYLLKSRLLPTDISEKLFVFETKYQLELAKLLEEIKAPVNLALDYNRDEVLHTVQLHWLVKTKISSLGQEMIKQAVSLAAGYYQPQPQPVTLPDGTQATELKVKPLPLNYQQIYINNQTVNVVYFDNDSYFAWYQQGDSILIGNSLKMMNRYIAKVYSLDSSPCLSGSSQAIVVDLEKIRPELGIKNLVFSSKYNQDRQEIAICY